MQNRHLDRYTYFCELAKTSQDFYLSYLGKFVSITPETKVLEIGCGEGGNLLPFAQIGCSVTGIDICYSRIMEASDYFKRREQSGTFICADFLVEKISGKFDIIIIHDVIEHINFSHKKAFMQKAKSLLEKNGIIFWGFPAWQMPFGGHQQICKNKVISHIPFIHLLPNTIYKSILKICREDNDCINELLNIKKTKVPIELFESLLKSQKLDIIDRCFWFINPHYKQKFKLKPRKMYSFLGKIPYIRNYFCTSCFYITH